MISLKTYYYLALLIPFAMRLSFAPSFFSPELSTNDAWCLPNVSLIPYTGFVGWCWFRFRDKSATEIGAFLAFSPLTFALMLLGYFMLRYYYNSIMGGHFSLGDTFSSALFLGLWSAFISACIGLGYMFIALLVQWVFLKCKIISSDNVS